MSDARQATRLAVEPIPVDRDGLRVDLLERSEAAAVIVTPAHQFPTGAVLSSERRAALVEWAERGERLIVEDDFDAELRYDRGGVGALQGLAPERIAYIGEQAAGAGDATGLDVDPVLAGLAADLGQGDRGPRLGGDRPARPARLHRARR